MKGPHLEAGADDGRHFRRAEILGRKNTLDHQEVRGPVAERDHPAEPNTIPIQ